MKNTKIKDSYTFVLLVGSRQSLYSPEAHRNRQRSQLLRFI
ncbi:hypothetical protein [Chroococcidiopsis thermalis]|nr:hypothetical protein [Chroococcidiopsis thermalis]